MKALVFRKPLFWTISAAIVFLIAAGVYCWAIRGDKGAASGNAPKEEASADKIFETIVKDLKKLPKKYSVEQQVKDGFFVIVHGKIKSESSIIEKFIEAVENKKYAEVTVVQLTVEGDPIITKVVYDGEMFYGVSDNSRDAFKGSYDDYIKFQYKYLKIFQEGSSNFALLVNDDSLTVDEYRKSTLSSNSKDWIDHYFLYSINNQ